ncbi:hypothetical protein C491_10154 [Natronococcus amylolyticus DSM 10524]|uniref:Uncharacterized protein n=1 Tax=Natronococcus amylolyticus DSM 10524 TaxID=1227497 RepID=L9X8U7_9EURY|nr:hypothetical protein [Natronococcus amylolyticus]ELY58150.1 hypothetical protein C491_10154 [Natronococcus amylolyticus DSM 10524]
MELRQRVAVGTLWIAVAALIAYMLYPVTSFGIDAVLQLVVLVFTLFLAGVYLFNPWGVLDRQPFH